MTTIFWRNTGRTPSRDFTAFYHAWISKTCATFAASANQVKGSCELLSVLMLLVSHVVLLLVSQSRAGAKPYQSFAPSAADDGETAWALAAASRCGNVIHHYSRHTTMRGVVPSLARMYGKGT